MWNIAGELNAPELPAAERMPVGPPERMPVARAAPSFSGAALAISSLAYAAAIAAILLGPTAPAAPDVPVMVVELQLAAAAPDAADRPAPS